jgi:hypothetical protein
VIARELLISLSVPGTTMTPVPMTKLPNSKGQRILGRAWLAWDGGILGGEGAALSIDAGCRILAAAHRDADV